MFIDIFQAEFCLVNEQLNKKHMTKQYDLDVFMTPSSSPNRAKGKSEEKVTGLNLEDFQMIDF